MMTTLHNHTVSLGFETTVGFINAVFTL